ncbi:MAG: pyridoxine 5'-phosphate synthase [Cytophagales bacterium]|nr:MAG: pyridoxine 5'-phosphate synthase [Cytophagales bacterium]TAF59635.1 MAG: pyridoxine 5'-phosphate synthase [Cytophagales bacterium]
MTKLSVNINKFATLRNARGGNNPDLVSCTKLCQQFGAEGITVHPRPDERHIRYQDVLEIMPFITTELNIEGNPQKGRFMELVRTLKPKQATLVPDGDAVLTSNAGWDTITHRIYLQEVIAELKSLGVRSSIFIDPQPKFIEGAALVGTDRIELYTEAYAHGFLQDPHKAVQPYTESAKLANSLGLGINAGHDLDTQNLAFFKQNVPHLLEVSIGHALVCDALFMGLEASIKSYLQALKV